jgi:predicted esterase
MHSIEDRQINPTAIDKTLFTARFINGFWDRWLAHGVEKQDLFEIRPTLTCKENWINGWYRLAIDKKKQADFLKQQEMLEQAEYMYRIAGLYFNLMYWIFPQRGPEKERWFRECFSAIQQADTLSAYVTTYISFELDGCLCKGRLRMPQHPKGCVVMVNPLDSSKEELITYELDFVRSGFATVSFDGPGQGETYLMNGLKGNRQRWIQFVNKVIESSCHSTQNLPIYLFGTSSGASWAIYGSQHPKVRKTVAVSPALPTDKVRLPDYFTERMNEVLEGADFLPSLEMLPKDRRILLFHGGQDVMVTDQDIYGLKEQLVHSQLVEYEEEGHCCNFKLHEIRQLSAQWFMED